MKSFNIHITPKNTGLANPLHLSAQLTYRTTIFTPKKGKGSYNRKKFKKIDY